MSALHLHQPVKNHTITISRQKGSLGMEIAGKTAALLGYRPLWRELIDQAANQAGVPELSLAAVDELGLLDLCPSPAACDAYHAAMREVMHTYASVGAYILVGRAGQTILKGVPGVMHVRIVAPLDIRIGRIAAAQGISVECAREQILASDHFRQHYLKKYFHINWNDSDLYDLVINTGRIPADLAAQQIGLAVEGFLQYNNS